MSRTCGPRDIISLVIPRLGDNKYNILKIKALENEKNVVLKYIGEKMKTMLIVHH
jgi:hypothetical protein